MIYNCEHLDRDLSIGVKDAFADVLGDDNTADDDDKEVDLNDELSHCRYLCDDLDSFLCEMTAVIDTNEHLESLLLSCAQ